MKKAIELEILSYINQNSGDIGFYHVARRFGLPEASYDLPVVLKQIIDDGLIAVTAHSAQPQEFYKLTEKGQRALAN